MMNVLFFIWSIHSTIHRTTYYTADLRHKYGFGGLIPLRFAPCIKSPFTLLKPKGRLAPASQGLGGDVQPPPVTVLTPATVPDCSAFYSSTLFCQYKKSGKGFRFPADVISTVALARWRETLPETRRPFRRFPIVPEQDHRAKASVRIKKAMGPGQ
jgi:hypothetical protein